MAGQSQRGRVSATVLVTLIAFVAVLGIVAWLSLHAYGDQDEADE